MDAKHKQNPQNRCDNSIKQAGKQTNNDVQSSASSDMNEINAVKDDISDKEEDMNEIANHSGTAHNTSADMLEDTSQDESDVSDTESDSDRCHSATQALRARLLNTPTNNDNPTVNKDSKLRVSVFDHRIMPNKLISERISANRVRDNTDSGDSECDNQRQPCVNSGDSKRQGSSVQTSVLRTRPKRLYNSDNITGSGTQLKMKRNSNFRTQFDILLRSLIGDVNDMQVESSPNTISSGYESDSVHAHDAEISEIFSKTKEAEKENKKSTEEKLTDYFSMSETYPNSCGVSPPSKITKTFSSLPIFPTQSAPEMDTNISNQVKESHSMRMLKSDNESNGFNYTQRHNYKLTKVTRSMYEIIHDLQSGEKNTIDGRKRSRKGRRTQDGHSTSDGNYSAKENRPRGRLQSGALNLDNKDTSLHRNQGNKDIHKSSVSGSVVRCVRRPLGSESSLRAVPRKHSHSDSHNRSSANGANSNADKVQNELRNLLCGTTDELPTSADNNGMLHNCNSIHSSNNTHGGFNSADNSHMSNGPNRLDVSICIDENNPESQRRLTITEQFIHRPKAEDHVYETIPGDEKLYEEWKKMRGNPKVPKIRRFTTVPDLPGTFVPKEPPALPERQYLNVNGSQNKCKPNGYIFMSDINCNISAKRNSDTGYASVSNDEMLTTRQCYYPSHDPFTGDHWANNDGRCDETSDGYCSIDNLSLLRENFTLTTSPPEVHSRNWNPRLTSDFNRTTQHPGGYFLQPVLSRTARTHNQSYGEELSSRDMGLFEYRKPDGTGNDSTLVATAFDGSRPTKQIVQATYV